MPGFNHSRLSKPSESGFALVVALSLMAFVLLLLLTLTTFVRVEAGASDVQRKESEARQNSLMALQVALGQLQKHVGPDQRVTARADVFDDDPAWDPAIKHWVGVFDTEGNGTEATSWLISQLNNAEDGLGDQVRLADIALNDQTKIRMQRLADGQDDANDIFADRIPVTNGAFQSGHMAYYVDDEGLKANVSVHAEDPGANDFEERAGRSVLPIPDTLARVLGDNTATTEVADKFSTLEGLNILDDQVDINEFSRDYTLYSKGVLADVKDGGLKKDLTIAFEENQVFSREFGGANQENLLVTQERLNDLESRLGEQAFPNGYANWSILKDYYNLYTLIQPDGTFNEHTRTDGIPLVYGDANSVGSQVKGPHGLSTSGYSGADDPQTYHNVSPVFSILERFQFTLWVSFQERDAPGNPSQRQLYPRLHVRPVLGFYNPYNIPLRVEGLRCNQRSALPFYLQLNGGDTHRNMVAGGGGTVTPFAADNLDEVLDPGEIIYFSYEGEAALTMISARTLSTSYDDFVGSSRYEDWVAVDANGQSVDDDGKGSADKVSVIYDPASGPGSPTYTINHGIFQHRADRMAGRFSGVTYDKQMIFNPVAFDSIPYDDRKPWRSRFLGKLLTPSTMTVSAPGQASEELTIGYWLRTSREDFQQLRPLADGNVRFMIADGRWDQVEGVELMSPFSGSDPLFTGSGDSRGEVSLPFPEVSDPGGANKGLWGAGVDNAYGSSSVVLFDVPRAPLLSLGQLQHANVARFNYEPTYVIGNSYANVRFPMDDVYGTIQDSMTGAINGSYPLPDFELYDISYLTNEALWDSYFFSTVPRGMTSPEFDSLEAGDSRLLNARYELSVPEGLSVDETALRELGDPADSAIPGAFGTNAGLFVVDGAFNVNSTSVDAWKAVLSSLANQEVPLYDPVTGLFDRWEAEDEIRFSRFSAPTGEDYSTDSENANFWNGYRTLSEVQVTDLATAIVEQVKARGPFLSMSDFVNRKLEASPLGRSGSLQAALDDPNAGINTSIGDTYQRAALLANTDQNNRLAGNQAVGFPGFLTQGDILQSLGPILSPRSDTFRIRAYGDSIDPVSGELISRAWCEAVVQRSSVPVGLVSLNTPSDLIDEDPEFGRQFEIVHFRWLTEDEI